MKAPKPRGSRPRLAVGSALAGLALAVWVRCGPLPAGLTDPGAHVSTAVVDRHGRPLYEALSARGGRGSPLPADALPERLVQATLAAEDARFFRHPGVDPVAVVRAVWHDLRARRLVEGGSTLTQQVVKQLTRRERTFAAKLREMVLALRLEHRLSKREVLALYLSVAPYGNQVFGAEAASRAYFGCPAAGLTAAQAAYLAALPQRPTAFNPRRSPGAARARQRRILGRMGDLGFLDRDELERALGEEVVVLRDTPAFLAPHFVERVRASVAGTPRRVETTLDAGLQAEVRGILGMHRDRLLALGAHNVAVAVLDNSTADWLAWEGSGDYEDPDHGGAIDGVVSPRQPGSALKPFTYALAFERGFTPASVLPDLPSHFPTAVPGAVYAPRNYDGRFRGPMRARTALAGSENVPAVWLLSQLGVPDLLRLLRRAGLTTLDRTADHYGYALTMGDAEVRLDELVAAYAALARGGVFRRPRMVTRTVQVDGAVEAAESSAPEPILSERAAFWIADVLSDPRARAWAFGTGGSLELPFPVAVKTGTSQAYRDNWTVGFTRDVTVGVWVGNFDRKGLRSSSGVAGAAPIFHDVMLAAQAHVDGRRPVPGGVSLAVPPGGLSPRTVCALSGAAATPACPSVETEWLLSGAETACTWHRRSRDRVVVAWPARYRAWASERGLVHTVADEHAAGPAALRRVSRTTRTLVADEGVRIVNPPEGALYLRDPTLRAEYQTLPLRAIAGPRQRLSWHVDGTPVGSSAADRPVHWPLTPGSHVISVRDEKGRQDQATILVK